MTYHEKSIWISLVSVFLVFGYYFIRIFKILTGNEVNKKETVVFFISIIIVIIIIEAVAHIFLTLLHKPEKIDERDKLIELRATRIAYFILVFGVFLSIGSVLISTAPLITAQIVLFFFILAEIVKFINQLVYYRKGV